MGKRLVKTVYGAWAEDVVAELNAQSRYGVYSFERETHKILGDIASIYCDDSYLRGNRE